MRSDLLPKNSAGARLRTNGMLLGLGVAVLLALVVPDLGARGGALRSEHTSHAAVMVIFLLQGLTLPTEGLRRGLLSWRLHLVTQASIFLLLPLLAWGLVAASGPLLTPSLRMGFLFLGVLPTTLATAVVFTAQSEGNVVGALFNTVVSNLAGVIIVPAAVAMWAAGSGETFPVGNLIMKIALLLAAPLLLGQLLRPILKAWIDPRRRWVGRINSGLILFIVFAAICDAVAGGVLGRSGGAVAAMAAGGAVILHCAAAWFVRRFAQLAGVEGPDGAAALFCGSQKTLAAGIPMAQSIFFGSELSAGVVILPLLFYHFAQLVLGVILIPRLFQQASLPPSQLSP